MKNKCPCGKPSQKNHHYCIDCSNKYSREWRKKNPYSTYSEEKKHKMRCRSYANSYLKLGKIDKGPCEILGCKEKPQMHHDDYDKPLMIRWMCKNHHREYHEKLMGPPLCPQCKKNLKTPGRGYCKSCESKMSANRQREKRRQLNPEKYNYDGTRKLKWNHASAQT